MGGKENGHADGEKKNILSAENFKPKGRFERGQKNLNE